MIFSDTSFIPIVSQPIKDVVVIVVVIIVGPRNLTIKFGQNQDSNSCDKLGLSCAKLRANIDLSCFN